MAALRSTSLRAQLSVTYAGIALLTAVLLGGILLSVLARLLLARRDGVSALRGGADPGRTAPRPTARDLRPGPRAPRSLEQVRIRVFDSSGELLADSGSPRDLDAGRARRARRRSPTIGRASAGPEPLGGGHLWRRLDGSHSGREPQGRRSHRLRRVGRLPGPVRAARPPVGRCCVGIAQAWTVAAVLAVALGRARRLPALVAHLQADRRADRRRATAWPTAT